MIYGKVSILSPTAVDTGVWRGAVLDKWALLDLIFQFGNIKCYLSACQRDRAFFVNKKLLNFVEYVNKLVGLILTLVLI